MEKGDPLPSHCSACGVYVGPDETFVPTKVNIGGSAIARSVDQSYRQYEAASIERAEAAGDPSLKVTNMRDNLREGDVAAMPVNNTVTQYAEAMKDHGFSYFQAAGQSSIADTLAMTKQGQERTTGQVALAAIQGVQGAPPPSVPGIRGRWGG